MGKYTEWSARIGPAGMAKKSKLNPRQEKFVREYVKTGNGRQSYLKAGYAAQLRDPLNSNSADVCASNLLKHPKVENALAAISARHLTRHDYTVDTILHELDEARDVALAALPGPQASAAVQASTVKARILGMIVDRKEVGAPGEFAGLDTARAILDAIAKELGTDAASALAKLVDEPVTIEATAVESDVE